MHLKRLRQGAAAREWLSGLQPPASDLIGNAAGNLKEHGKTVGVVERQIEIPSAHQTGLAIIYELALSNIPVALHSIAHANLNFIGTMRFQQLSRFWQDRVFAEAARTAKTRQLA